MQALSIALGYPTVLFTTVLLTSVSYWILSMVLGFDGGGADLDFDVDVSSGSDSASGDAGADGAGFFAGILHAFDLHLMPLALVLTVVSLVGFLISALGTFAFGNEANSSILVGLILVAVSLIAGMFIAGKVAVVLAPIFVPEPHIRRADLVGKLCRIQTGSVSALFGQAEAVDSGRSTHIIQVRCDVPNDLRAGSPALIVSVDEEGDYLVSPDVDGLV